MGGPCGAEEFAGVAAGAAATELDRLLDRPALPVSREDTWHAVASVLLATADRWVLLARNRYGWGTVGGHVEPSDASLRAAVVREAREELGVAILPEDLAPLSFVVDEREVVPGCAHWDFCFVLQVPTQIEATPQSDVTDAAWFSLDALPAINDHMSRHLDALHRLHRPGPAGWDTIRP